MRIIPIEVAYALPEIFLRFNPHRRDHLRARRGDRSRRGSQAQKRPSKNFGDTFGHTPISTEEKLPWKYRRLVIGTGTGALPVMDEVKQEAKRRKIKLVILPTKKAIQELKKEPSETNAILHVTC